MSSLIEFLARAGYAARGVVYAIIGFFAVLAALGRSETTDSQGALETVLAQPFGAVLVGLMVVGLAGYALWRFIQAIRDPDRHGTRAKGIAVRLSLAVSGATHVALALFALGLLLGWGSGGGGGDPTGGWLAAAYDAGIGWLIVYGVAAILFVVGGALIYKGWKAKFERYIHCPPEIMRKVRPVAQLGLIARGVVFLILGALVFTGGLTYDASNAPGMTDALAAVQGYSFGWLILLAIALGLVCFAIYSFLEARYRSIQPQ